MRGRGSLIAALTVAALAAALAPSGAAAKPGDILAADDNYGGFGEPGAWLRIDPATGAHTVLSMATGANDNPEGIGIDSLGRILLIDRDAPGAPNYPGTISRLDLRTGARTTLFTGTPMETPADIVPAPGGGYLFVDSDSNGSGGDPPGQVFRLPEAGGTPTALTSSTLLEDPNDLVVFPDGSIYVSDSRAGADGGVFRIAPGGEPISLFTGTDAQRPTGLGSTPDGDLLVAVDGDTPGLLRLDPRTRAVAPVVALGIALQRPQDVAMAPDGTIYVSDPEQPPFNGTVVQVDPKTKVVSFLASGAPLGYINAIALEPPTCMGRTATIVGSTEKDRLVGSKFADVIVGLAGNDKIKGGKGKDRICAGGGRDQVSGGGGKDRCSGGGGRDSGGCERGRL